VTDREKLRCGLWVVDLLTGFVAAHLEFCTGVEEVFDVQVLPGIASPYVSGPAAEKNAGQPLWTVPPPTVESTFSDSALHVAMLTDILPSAHCVLGKLVSMSAQHFCI
jgi:hypothetical protein